MRLLGFGGRASGGGRRVCRSPSSSLRPSELRGRLVRVGGRVEGGRTRKEGRREKKVDVREEESRATRLPRYDQRV